MLVFLRTQENVLMKEEDAEQLTDDLRALESLLDGNAIGIHGGQRLLAASLLGELGGVIVTYPRLARSVEDLCFAVRGCYEDSRQFHLLVDLITQIGLPDVRARAMKALWARAHEAVAELREDMDRFRRRSS
jgi:hypothetical protein